MSPLEKSIANAWTEVLGVECVDKEQNLFDLGAESLSAIQMVNRLQDLLKINISIRDIFENPTIKSIAKYIEKLIDTV